MPLPQFIARTPILSSPDGPPALTVGSLVALNGFIYSTGAHDGALTRWTIGADGALEVGQTGTSGDAARLLGGTMAAGVALPIVLTGGTLSIGAHLVSPLVAVAAVTAVSAPLADGQALYFAAAGGGVLQITLNAAGLPIGQSLTRDTDEIFAGDLQTLHSFTSDGTAYLAGASSQDTGLSLWRIQSDGSLVEASSIGPDTGLWIAAPTAIETLVVAGETYLLVGAAGSSSISVLHLDAGGGLTLTDHVLDDRNSRFDTLQAMTAVTHQGQSYVIAGGGDDGFTIFQLLPGGRLIARAHVPDTIEAGLQNITAITASSGADGITFHIASGVEGGISTFRWAPDGTTTTNGRAGGLGDDVIVDPGGARAFTGGAGADLFVIAAGRQAKSITDFTLGEDRIDLSKWGMIRSLDQLTLTTTETGFQVSYGNFNLTVHSANGQPIDIANLSITDLINLTHIPPTLPKTNVAVPSAASEDMLIGTGGHDVLQAGDGGVTVYALEGNDIVIGGAGNDILIGGLGNDHLEGVAGNNYIFGGPGNNMIIGGTGNDILVGGAGSNKIIAGGGNNIIYDGAGPDRMVSGPGANLFVLMRDSQPDVIEGFQLGKDRIDLSSWGASGIAALNISQTASGAIIRFGAELLEIFTADQKPLDLAALNYVDLFATALPAPLPPVQATRGQNFGGTSASDSLAGTQFNDTLRGYGGNDVLFGWDGDDTLYGNAGNDWLIGGRGADTMYGGVGDDNYHVDDPGDLVIENPDQGNDTVYAEITYTLPANVENLRLLGDANLNGYGNELDNLLVGNYGDNYLEGGAGNDWLAAKAGSNILYGGPGRDWLVGGTGPDIFLYKDIADSPPGQSTRDLINNFTRGQDRIDLSAIDADQLADGHQSFTFIGANAFSGMAGELRYATWNQGWLIIEADVTGDGSADMQIFVNLLNEIGAEDFIL